MKSLSFIVKCILHVFLIMIFWSSNLIGQSNSDCYLNVKSPKGLNQVLVTNISQSLISQYMKQISPIPSGGLSGSNHCIYEVSVTKAEKKTFVTLQGKDLNAFGDSDLEGTDGFQQAILRSLYRSQRDKRGLICSDYNGILSECGNEVVTEGNDKRRQNEEVKPVVQKDKREKTISKKKKPAKTQKSKCVWKCIIPPCDDDMLPKGCVWSS